MKNQYCILLIEDDTILAGAIKDCLELNGYRIFHTTNGENGVKMYERHSPDLVILDIMLPGKNGFEVLQDIRNESAIVPVIIMTGTHIEPKSEIKSYESGVVNFLKKPVYPEVLLALIKSKLSKPNVKEFQINNSIIRIEGQILKIDGMSLYLRHRECIVLITLLHNQNKTVSRKDLLRAVWTSDNPELNNMLDGVIFRLRTQLKFCEHIFCIVSQYSKGYILRT